MRTSKFALAAVLLSSACGTKASDASLTFAAEPLQMVATNGKTFNVAIRSSPQPPTLGQCNFEYTVTDMTGAPIDGLTIGVTPWMPQMGHGSPVTPSVKDVGGGVYQVTDVYLFMGGEWQLRTILGGNMDGGMVSDTMDPVFQIP